MNTANFICILVTFCVVRKGTCLLILTILFEYLFINKYI